MLQHFLNPPNWFTSASIFCSFYAMMLVSGGETDHEVFYRAGLFVAFAGVFDMLDGRVARLTKRGSEFGIQLDSLADVVSFGVAPAMLMYHWGLKDYGLPGVMVAFAFLLCGAFRLARFNTKASTTTKGEYSEGITITMAGAVVTSVVMVHAEMALAPPPFATLAAILLTLAGLMVSTVPFPTFAGMPIRFHTRMLMVLAMGAFVSIGVIYDIAFCFLSAALTYLITGPALAVLQRRRAALHQGQVDLDEELDDEDGD